ncbi:MAG: PQQ-binding-like beta-propeller repeat protein [Planctomycetaceae bacterium]|nr:PQQ-binding-like beta-propeller repeat protein [Planctomycetaceae bacterium]
MRFLIPALLLIPSTLSVHAEDWSGFRGAHGTGASDARNLPLSWSSSENIAWKVPLPGNCNGSPVVAGNRIFVTSASEDGRQRTLHCISADDGATLWEGSVSYEQKMPTHQTNLYGGTTPAATSDRVVVWHASAGLFCYDHAGELKWQKSFGEFRHQWGYGTSPVIDNGVVFLHSGPGRNVFIAAFDLSSGDQKWKFDEPIDGDGERNSQRQYMGSWCTPVLVNADERQLLVCGMATRVIGLDSKTGELVWSCDGLRGERGDLCYTSPVIGGDVCVVMGGYQGPAIGFRMEGTGNITDSGRLWRVDKGNPQRIGSGVVVDGLLYMANAGPNLMQCIQPETGEVLWEERVRSGAHWGSLVSADGVLLTTGQNGDTLVIRPSAQGLDLVRTNSLGENTNSTPAVADGAIYIRTFGHLWCIRK